MGNTESGLVSKSGFHVLQIQPGSPATGLLSPFWDVIVGAQQQLFDPSWKEDSRLVELFKAYEHKALTLIVHSIKTEKTREVVIVPNGQWGGTGLVGISIRFCSFDHTLELVWRVLDVYVDSPASRANLCSRTDYIIGTPDHIFTDAEDFFNLVNVSMNKTIRLYVYNTVTEDVSITPNKDWGGSGSLGCDIGYGYLHRIPLGDSLDTTSSPTASHHSAGQQPTSPISNVQAINTLTTQISTTPDAAQASNFTNNQVSSYPTQISTDALHNTNSELPTTAPNNEQESRAPL